MEKLFAFFLTLCPFFASAQELCAELKIQTQAAMTATGSQIVSDYNTDNINRDVQIDIHDVNDGQMIRAFFIRKRGALDGFILMEFDDRFEIYGVLNDYSGLHPVPLELWHGFKSSPEPIDFYENMFYDNPLFSYMRYICRQQNCRP